MSARSAHRRANTFFSSQYEIEEYSKIEVQSRINTYIPISCMWIQPLTQIVMAYYSSFQDEILTDLGDNILRLIGTYISFSDRDNFLNLFKSNRHEDLCTTIITLTVMLNFSWNELIQMSNSSSWVLKRSMAETVVDYWPATVKLKWISKFCPCPDYIWSCSWSMGISEKTQLFKSVSKKYLETIIFNDNIGMNIVAVKFAQNKGITYQWIEKNVIHCDLYYLVKVLLILNIKPKDASIEFCINLLELGLISKYYIQVEILNWFKDIMDKNSPLYKHMNMKHKLQTCMRLRRRL